MTSLLQGIGAGFAGTWNGLSAGAQKISANITNSTHWNKASEVATPYFQRASSYYPELMKFNFSKDFAAGAIAATGVGAFINLYSKR